MQKKIDIILTTYNRLEFTKQTIQSIIFRTKIPYRLIVVDNNSTDGTRDYLIKKKKQKKIHVLILNNENRGLERALNQGLKEVRNAPYFVTVDNDCVAPLLRGKCWARRLLDLMESHPQYAAIALRPQVLIGVGEIFKGETGVVPNNVVGGSYRMMDLGRVKQVGGWTDRIENDGRGKEEWDVCSKLRQNGDKVGYISNIFCYHLFGKEGTWGYSKDSNYRMGRYLEKSPEDVKYNPITCEPFQKNNE